MTSLRDIVDGMAIGDGEITVEAPAAWSQGRTLYGGMTAALCFEVARRVAPEIPLRSAHLLFAGPAGGVLTLRPRLLRSGRSSAALTVACSGEAGEAAIATFAFGKVRESRVEMAAPPRPVPAAAPEDCPLFVERSGGFHDRFELRLTEGSALMSGGAPEFTVWVRFREQQAVNPVTALLALADALPPAAMASFPERAPISTISWSIDLLCEPERIEGWYLLRTGSEQTQDGYSTQAMDLWDAAGQHLATGRQLVAIFI
jgi:acyl-CoA thioesterase